MKKKSIELRANDCIKVIEEGCKYHIWKTKMGPEISNYPKIINNDQNENGLFVEFVIVKLGSTSLV